jgi:hypothetical protein
MRISLLIFFSVIIFSIHAQSQVGWPQTGRQTKPWTRWWWQGSAATKEGLTSELEALKNAGIGGVEITPIYGVYGYEKNFVNFLSPQWMELLTHVLKEAERLDLGVDMATGTGWPFGGPWISEKDACKNLQVKVYEVKSGASLREKIEFVQAPYLRAIGSQVYEADAQGQRKLKAPLSEFEGKKIDIRNIKDPIESNTNLQAYAIDQVQFEKKLPLQSLMAYSSSGKVLELTSKVGADGSLQWTAPAGDWKLYAVFQGWHGKMVERAAPGGEGNVVDHFSPTAVDNYFAHFNEAFKSHDISSLRAFFNDSYEVDDAKGSADWTPALFDEFIKRRGYDLRLHLPALIGNDTPEKNERILIDYRETISEMLQDHFTKKWKSWAAKHGAIIRNQAHGSPANILDLYAVVDIPEIEGTEPLRIKMASSSGNVMGKPLVSSESATWLDDHFETSLSHAKEALDRFMLHGVNHMFYHGTNYSPVDEPWPGWLFYAAVHFNNRNPFWDHFTTLNKYVERSQSFLQNSKPDNEVLLYFPVYDGFAHRGSKRLEHFDAIDKKFEGSSFAKTAEALHHNGTGFDYVSDAQIRNLSVSGQELVTEGKSHYKFLVVPGCKYMPLPTLEKINELVKSGVNVIFINDLPQTFSGFADLGKATKRFKTLTKNILSSSAATGNVKIFKGKEPSAILDEAAIPKEIFSMNGLAYLRKKQADGSVIYFINNQRDEKFEGWTSLQKTAKAVVVYDPMTGEFGKARTKSSGNEKTDVYLQLEPKQSLILQLHEHDIQAPEYIYTSEGTSTVLQGEWQLKFLKGGPELPEDVKTKTLSSWTTMGSEKYSSFSGTCTYSIAFNMPLEKTEVYMLDLGLVKESASVILNGKSIGTLIGPTYKVKIPAELLRETNILEVQVANAMANRIAYMDKNRVFWKKFYNVNFPALKAENRVGGLFDASHWNAKDSGLLGPVTLTPLKQKTVF